MKFVNLAPVIFLVSGIYFPIYGGTPELYTPAKLSQISVPENVTSADIGGARIQANQKDLDAAMESIMLLASLIGQDDYLELLWWRSQQPNVRILIVALFTCRTTEDRDGVLPFELSGSRFASSEAAQRKKEVEFVRGNIIDFARALEKITSNRPRCAELHRQYASVVKTLESQNGGKK